MRLALLAVLACAILSPAWAAQQPSLREGPLRVGPLRVGLTGKYPPFNYFDESGNLAGFDVEVAQELCRRIGRSCEFKTLAWDGILAALMSKKIDAVIGSMAITEERSKQALFTDPYYESGAQLFVRSADADPQREGFRIGVTLGTTYGEFARKRFPLAEIRTYKGDTEVFQDLESGRLDGMVTDRLVGSYINQRRAAGLRQWGPLLFSERIGIPVRRGEVDLHDALNRALQEFRASPAYAALSARYFGPPSNSGEVTAFRWLPALQLMLKGLKRTVFVSVEGLTLGILASVLLATLMIVPPASVRFGVVVFVDFIRATPFMIQLFAIYFGLPSLGVSLTAWHAAVFAIALHSAAYLAEILKVAYLSVPQGQHLAARVLGLTPMQSVRHVIVPQMTPLLFAPSLNTLVAMIKDSAVVSVISVYELTLQAQQLISATFRPIEFYAIAALLYAVITYPLLIAGRRLEAHYKSRGLLSGAD